MIGIFDSGIGGLGIFIEIKKLLPRESIIYLADTANCPYGEKSDRLIKKIALDNAEFLINKGCNIIVIACNTASTIALEYVRSKVTKTPPTRWRLVQVVGVVPVVKTASEVSKNKRIGILATKKTVQSKYLQKLVDQFCPVSKGYKIYYQEANELVGLVENGNCHPERLKGVEGSLANASFANKLRDSSSQAPQNDTIKIIKKYLQSFIKHKVDTIALSCTHFPFLRTGIEKIMGPKVKVLDSNGAVARQVRRIVLSVKYQVSSIKKPKHQFFTTGNSKKLKPVLEKLLGEKIDLVGKI